MLCKDVKWIPSGYGKILRILSCEDETSILYSWIHLNSIEYQSLIFIRHFNPINNNDKVLLVCHGNAKIVYASTSFDHQAIAITLWFPQDQVAPNEKMFDVLTDISMDDLVEIEDIRPILSHDLSISTETLDENLIPDCKIGSLPSPINCNNGFYKCYLSQSYPTRWCLVFSEQSTLEENYVSKFPLLEEKLFQKSIFTKFQRSRVTGDIKLSEYELLHITHKHQISLFSLVLQYESDIALQQNLQVAGKNYTIQSDGHHSRLYGQPVCEILTEKVLWSQWDGLMQRLYYLISPSTSNKYEYTEKSFVFCCIQFYPDSPKQEVFKVELELDISKHAIESSTPNQLELDPAVTNRDLNMRLCIFRDSGLLCLCWQEIPSVDFVPNLSYNILVLNKSVIVGRHFQRGEAMAALSFLAIGRNLVVQCPGSYLHVYDVEALNTDTEQMKTGLYHITLTESHYPQLCGTSLEYLFPCHQENLSLSINDNLSWNSVDSFGSSLCTSHCQAIVCFDRKSKNFVNILTEPEEFSKMFFDPNLTLQNRVFLTRQAVFAKIYDETAFEYEDIVFNFISKDPTNPAVTAILSQLLIASSFTKLHDPQHSIPSQLFGLFPVTLPASTLRRMIYTSEQDADDVYYGCCKVGKEMKSQIEKFVTGLFSSQLSDSFYRDPYDKFARETVTASWMRSMNSCESGSFTEYNLDCIRDQVNNLESSYSHPGLITKKVKEPFNEAAIVQQRLHRLQTISSGNCSSSNDDLLVSLSNGPQSCFSFLNQSEKNMKSENLHVLTYIKLCDHMLANYKLGDDLFNDDGDLKMMARNYVHSQIQSTHDLLCRLMMKFERNYQNKALYVRASSSEQNLLFTLNQFQLACEISCFPLPNGFQTFITCFTFRSLLARHASTDSNSLSEEGLHYFSDCLFDYVDRKLIQLTDEFVKKMLKELGSKELFGSVVEQVLIRTRSLEEDDLMKFDGLLMWRNVKSDRHMAKAYLKELYKIEDECSTSSTDTSRKRANSLSGHQQNQFDHHTESVRNKDNGSSVKQRFPIPDENINLKESSKYGFPPFDAFLEFVRRSSRRSRKINSLIDGDNEKIADLVEACVVQQIG